MKAMLILSMIFAGAVACGSKSDSNTTASATPTADESHHADGHHADGHHGDAPTDATVVPPGEATVGDTTTCPVSKETFVVAENSPKVEHEGKTYYFCCAGCEKKFADDPTSFMSDGSSS